MKTFRFLAAVCVSILANSAHASDYPDIKSGLWSTTVTMGQNPPQNGQMCTGSDLLKTMGEMQKSPDRPCKTTAESHSGSTYTVQTVCNFNGQVRNTTSVTTVTGNTALHTEVTDKDGTAPQMISDSKYVGACPAGMVQGDFIGANGMKFNILHPAITGGTPPPPPPPPK